jgi:acetyl-CoA synthetase
VEAAFGAHPLVAEAAVVGIPHSVKGSAVYAYVTLRDGAGASEELKKVLAKAVADDIGAFARPDSIHWAAALPKTRSGKIMRRILKKIADPASFAEVLKDKGAVLGDISTLAAPEVVDDLIASRAPLAKL